MRIIDAHQHFWNYNPERDAWITPEMGAIRRDFLPADLSPVLMENSVESCIAVQAEQSEAETHFLLQLAEKENFIKGVVGWVDLQSPTVEERLAYFSQFQKLKGFRHILQGEAKRDLMLTPAFQNGIRHLQQYNFTYDILIYPDQLAFTETLVASFPEQKFIIDHLAKPVIKNGELEEWRKGMLALANYPNVFCKVSGMVTEADWSTWKKEDFRPYLDVVTELFTTSRLLFGSDWPVCLVAASYKDVLYIVQDYFSNFPVAEQKQVFAENAERFYNL
ncbi:amidohydrolase family protein [Flavisolibacter sp. BT320]|nr:amidohydrolase family protein [Flavisolibacter longurius]